MPPVLHGQRTATEAMIESASLLDYCLGCQSEAPQPKVSQLVSSRSIHQQAPSFDCGQPGPETFQDFQNMVGSRRELWGFLLSVGTVSTDTLQERRFSLPKFTPKALEVQNSGDPVDDCRQAFSLALCLIRYSCLTGMMIVEYGGESIFELSSENQITLLVQTGIALLRDYRSCSVRTAITNRMG